jgi:nucleotide-binding universal stress UspA family protein
MTHDVGKMTEWYASKVNLGELKKAMEEKSKQELQMCCNQGLGGYKNVEYRLLTGIPDEEILKFQKENNIDLIVIGTNSRKMAYNRRIFGSTAQGCELFPVPGADRNAYRRGRTGK